MIKQHLPVSTKYFMEHLLFLEQEELQKIKCRCQEERLYVNNTGWPSLHAQVANNNKNGNALLHVVADIINLIDAPKRTFSPVWVNTSELDGSVGYGLLWSMEEALRLEKDVEETKAVEHKVFSFRIAQCLFPDF